MRKAKYIITKQKAIIVFSEFLLHSTFRSFEPVSAGFISFSLNKEGNPTCSCYGESVSLGLKSNPEDSLIAQANFNML